MQRVADYMGNGTPIKYNEIKTLTGLTLAEAFQRLEAKLEPGAYKNVKVGGKQFTDIKPAFLTEALNECFGMCGIGWYYDFDEVKVEKYPDSKGNTRFQADIDRGWLAVRFKLVDDTIWETEPIRATGGSDNDAREYAVRGALTNMLGAAASKLNWQLFVYKGEKDDEDKKESGKKVVEAPKFVTDPNDPWYIKAYKYAQFKGKDVLDKPLGATETGKSAIGRLSQTIGKDGWFNAKTHFDNAVKACTGFKTIEECGWNDFLKLCRTYGGPLVNEGETVSQVLWQHFMKPSEWQDVLHAIPLEPDFQLNADAAAIFNTVIPTAAAYRPKGGKFDYDAMAGALRKNLINVTAEDVPAPQVDIETEEEIPY